MKKPGKETMCTSELGENPADDAMGIPAGSFLPLVPLFSTSDSDSELSSMVLSHTLSLSLCLSRLRRINPPIRPRLQKTQSHADFNFNVDPERWSKIKFPQCETGPLDPALCNFCARLEIAPLPFLPNHAL